MICPTDDKNESCRSSHSPQSAGGSDSRASFRVSNRTSALNASVTCLASRAAAAILEAVAAEKRSFSGNGKNAVILDTTPPARACLVNVKLPCERVVTRRR